MAEKKKFKDFESALTRLEEITKLLESGEVKLEEAMASYAEGIEIAEFCQKKLSEVEKEITILKEKNREFRQASKAADEDDDDD